MDSLSSSFHAESCKIDTGERMVTFIGEIDLATAPAMEKALQRCKGRIVVDLRKVPFMDSSGLRVLLQEMNRLNGNGGAMRLLGVSDQIRKIFEISGLTNTFQIDSSIHPERSSNLTVT